VRPIITETTEAAAVLDRLMMACVTGKNAETVLGPGGLGALTEHKLWTEAAEGIARLDAVHRDAQRAFLNTWMRVGYVLRGYVADDDAFFAMLRKLLPAYDGPAQSCTVVNARARLRNHHGPEASTSRARSRSTAPPTVSRCAWSRDRPRACHGSPMASC
jgi:hypothetical protein